MKTRRSSELLKHVLILGVLVFAFLPLYVMFVTAFKTNHEFFVDPWGVPRHFEWGNWSIGWLTVKDLIATTLVVAATTVAGTLAVTSFIAAWNEFMLFLFSMRLFICGLMAGAARIRSIEAVRL